VFSNCGAGTNTGRGKGGQPKIRQNPYSFFEEKKGDCQNKGKGVKARRLRKKKAARFNGKVQKCFNGEGKKVDHSGGMRTTPEMG